MIGLQKIEGFYTAVGGTYLVSFLFEKNNVGFKQVDFIVNP